MRQIRRSRFTAGKKHGFPSEHKDKFDNYWINIIVNNLFCKTDVMQTLWNPFKTLALYMGIEDINNISSSPPQAAVLLLRFSR